MPQNDVPVGFGFYLNQNTAAMNRYAQLSHTEKQAILDRAQCATNKEEMYALVASLANGILS